MTAGEHDQFDISAILYRTEWLEFQVTFQTIPVGCLYQGHVHAIDNTF